ncbi:MAG: Hpt domain-containing protein [Enterobacterales bacterium]|nr:Hpt domain-containing protein [Enterobacterales bacterium]
MTGNVDKKMLQDLTEIMGDDMKLLITSYIQDSQNKIAEWASLDIVKQQNEIYRMAHSLKGSSRNVGAMLFADYCEKVETLARQESLTSKDFSIEQLRCLFDAVHTELKQMFL